MAHQFYLKTFYFISFLALTISIGCGEETTTPQDPGVPTTNPYIRINHFDPNVMPTDSFQVYLYCQNFENDSEYVSIKVEEHTPTHCDAILK